MITAMPNTPPHVRGIINLRGKVIPVVDVRISLGLEERWHRLHDDYAEQCGWDAEEREVTTEVVRDVLPTAGHDVARAVGDRRGAAVLAACDLASAAGEATAARLRSVACSSSAAFLNALPVVPATRLGDDDFRTHARLRLGLGMATNAQLPACSCHIGDTSEVEHPLVCNHTKGDAKMRHDLVTRPCAWPSGSVGAAA